MSGVPPRREWPVDVLGHVLSSLVREAPRQLFARELWCGAGAASSWWARQRSFSTSLAGAGGGGSLPAKNDTVPGFTGFTGFGHCLDLLDLLDLNTLPGFTCLMPAGRPADQPAVNNTILAATAPHLPAAACQLPATARHCLQ